MKEKLKYKVATIEARMGSSRLPGKVLMPLAGKPALERMVDRIRRANCIDQVVLATTVSANDDELVNWAKSIDLAVFRGSEDDVLRRVLNAAQAFKADIIIELTGDCPLIDPEIIDQLMKIYLESDSDYVSNILTRTYPRGLDTQIFSTEVLAQVDTLTIDPADRENVSLYIYEHPEIFKLKGLEAPPELFGPERRWCVDTQEDYEVLNAIFEALVHVKPDFTSLDVFNFLKQNPDIQAINEDVIQKKAR